MIRNVLSNSDADSYGPDWGVMECHGHLFCTKGAPSVGHPPCHPGGIADMSMEDPTGNGLRTSYTVSLTKHPFGVVFVNSKGAARKAAVCGRVLAPLVVQDCETRSCNKIWG